MAGSSSSGDARIRQPLHRLPAVRPTVCQCGAGGGGRAQVQLLGTSAPAVPRVELTPDSGVFVIVYGTDDKPETGTVTLHGVLPAVPSGVLDAARRSGGDVVTWQPELGLGWQSLRAHRAEKS